MATFFEIKIMLELTIFTSIIIIILSVFQSIVGIGILVLGTPILLLAGLEMIEVMRILLPLSILNSLLNIIYIKLGNKKIKTDKSIKKLFFLICFPGVFFGIIFLRFFDDLINFNILVSFVIWVVLLISYFNKENNFNFLKKNRKTIILLTGFVHGLTNSGGSLLSILIIKTYNKSLNFLRYQIIFFYFFLALFQYIFIFFVYDSSLLINLELMHLLSLILGVFFGNLLLKRVNNSQIKSVIFFVAFLSSIFLLLKS